MPPWPKVASDWPLKYASKLEVCLNIDHVDLVQVRQDFPNPSPQISALTPARAAPIAAAKDRIHYFLIVHVNGQTTGCLPKHFQQRAKLGSQRIGIHVANGSMLAPQKE